jgi:hypothetical protein
MLLTLRDHILTEKLAQRRDRISKALISLERGRIRKKQAGAKRCQSSLHNINLKNF